MKSGKSLEKIDKKIYISDSASLTSCQVNRLNLIMEQNDEVKISSVKPGRKRKLGTAGSKCPPLEKVVFIILIDRE